MGRGEAHRGTRFGRVIVGPGLTHPDSVRDLIRRVDRSLPGSPALRAEVEVIRQRILRTGNQP